MKVLNHFNPASGHSHRKNCVSTARFSAVILGPCSSEHDERRLTLALVYSRLSLLRNPWDPVKMFVESEIRFRRNAVQCVAKYEVQRHVVSKFKCKYKKNELWGYCNVLPRFSRHCQDSQSRLTFVGHSLQGCFICLSGYSIEDYMYM